MPSVPYAHELRPWRDRFSKKIRAFVAILNRLTPRRRGYTVSSIFITPDRNILLLAAQLSFPAFLLFS